VGPENYPIGAENRWAKHYLDGNVVARTAASRPDPVGTNMQYLVTSGTVVTIPEDKPPLIPVWLWLPYLQNFSIIRDY